jgi:ribosomal protein S18 acetylase RimI-like enzyme
MPTKLTIRSATAADLPDCCQLDASLETDLVWQMKREDTAQRQTVIFDQLRLPRPIRVAYPRAEAELHHALRSPDGVLVAEVDGIILGYVQVALHPVDATAMVYNGAVDEPYRRRRIGTGLLHQAQAWARRRDAKRLIVETTARSYPTIRFLQQAGFTFSGFNDSYYASQDIAVFFGKVL